MELSIRLRKIASMIETCNKMADIGTDHAYLPIYLIKEGICDYAVASDINKGPVEKAKKNIISERLENKIECRLGGGLATLRPNEVQCAVIAGMGGNLIRDILQESMEVFNKLDYCVLQPVQNPEVLREYIYSEGFNIIDEELCLEDDKYYEIIKVKYDNKPRLIEPIYYEIGERLLEKQHPLIHEYMRYKLNKCYKIYNNIEDVTYNTKARKCELKDKIEKLEELLEK